MGSKEDDIHSAARNGNVIDVELIISSNPLAANSRDKHSRTPLHLAAWAGHANVVNALCKHKADVGAAAMDDMAAIHFAAQKGHLEVVKTLVSSGAPVKATNRKGMTALHYAVQGSYVELTKYLLKKGFDLDAKTKAGKSVFDLANNEELVKRPAAKEAKDGKSNKLSEDKGKEEELENSEENLKRKGEGDDIQESSPKPKKSKVALNHLLATDDTQDEDQ
ncbi:hypothetical protein RDABS01_026091 [Bienertia sinuspersici]